MVKIAVLLVILALIYNSLDTLNSAFLENLPVGYLSFTVVAILIIHHLYKMLRWNYNWLRLTGRWEKTLIHVCLYLIIFSVVFSVKLPTLKSPEPSKGTYDMDYGVGTKNDVSDPVTKTRTSGGQAVNEEKDIFTRISEFVTHLTKSLSSPNSEVIGTWEYSIGELSATLTFNRDGTGEEFAPTFFGIGIKRAFEYRVENDKIILFNVSPCFDADCSKEEVIKFRRSGNTLIVYFKNGDLPFRRV